nr:4689_t:CDS:2 [Entrophospora candida]
MGHVPSKQPRKRSSASSNNSDGNSSSASNNGTIKSNRSSDSKNVDGFTFNCNIDNFSSREIISHQSAINQTVDRKHRQHFLVKYVWDGNFSSPIEQKLSDGCKVAEIKMSFVENILKQDEWSIILEESLRILKPGGYLEYLEYETKIYDAGPKVTTFVDKFAKYLESVDRYQRLPFELFSTFPQLQNINIESRKSKTCYKHDDKVAELQFELFELYYESIVDIFSEYMGITKQEYADLWEEYRIESKSYTKAYTKMYKVWAQKKLN